MTKTDPMIDPATLAELKAALKAEITTELRPPDLLTRPGPAEFFATVRELQARARRTRTEASRRLAECRALEAERLEPARAELQRELLAVNRRFAAEEQRHAREIDTLRQAHADVNARMAGLERDAEARATAAAASDPEDRKVAA